jgi:hypothetical protein
MTGPNASVCRVATLIFGPMIAAKMLAGTGIVGVAVALLRSATHR